MTRNLIRTSVLTAAAAAAAACSSAPPAPILRENVQEVRATVVDVQKDTRRVTLRCPDASVLVVEAGPEVRNFDQIAPGDSVVASYYEAINFEVKDPAAAESPTAAVAVAGRAAPGEKPGAGGAIVVQTTVTFLHFDERSNMVTFTGEDGRVHAARVRRADGREFAKKLERGQQVVITASEGVAVLVTPAAK